MSGPLPRENLVRAISPGVELREDAEPAPGMLGKTLIGHFARFDEWAEIHSDYEGHFMERLAPTAFARTIAEDRGSMRALFQHGKDPQVGDKPLGPIDVLEVDKTGPRYEVPLIDTSYNRDIVPGLEAGLYGASFRFSVDAEEFVERPSRSKHNPNGLPERTITEARVFEFGPVTFPAYAGATAGVRSLTDDYRGRASPVEPPAIEPTSTLIETPKEPEVTTETETRAEPVAISRTERPGRITELRSLAEKFANEHPGNLSQDDQVEWDTLTSELTTLERAQRADDERLSFIRAAAGSPQHAVDAVPAWQPKMFNTPQERVRDIYDMSEIRSASRNEADHRQLIRDSAMRAIETASFPPPYDAQSARSQVSNLVDYKDTSEKEVALRILRTGNPVYRRAFEKAVRGHDLNEAERAAALEVVGTTTTGGYAVPYVFDPTIIHTGAFTNINPYRGICRVETITGGNVWRGVSAGAITPAYRAEGAAMVEGGPTFALPTFTAQRADAFVTLSRETLQDRPDITAELASIIGEGKATYEETQFSIGVGTTVFPLGMFVKSTFTVKETITNDVFAVADLDATEAALPIRHRREAVWMLSRAVIRIIQGWETAYGKLFNSTLGYPAVGDIVNNPGGNTGLSLLGYPVWETPSAPATVTTDDTIVGILVSPKNYIIVDRVGMEVELVPNLFDATTGFPTGQRGLMAIWRNTAGTLNADAGRQININ